MNNDSIVILTKGLIDHAKSRLDLVFEYIQLNPSLLKNEQIKDKLIELQKVLDKIILNVNNS
jgi:hypothetical protein